MFARFAKKKGRTNNRCTLHNLDCHISVQLATYLNSQRERERGTRRCVYTQSNCCLNEKKLTDGYKSSILVCLCRSEMDIDKEELPAHSSSECPLYSRQRGCQSLRSLHTNTAVCQHHAVAPIPGAIVWQCD